MKLIEHIVRNDRPFTEIVTADYIMVTPYTARGYGIFDEVQDAVQEPGRSVRVHPGQAQGARWAASKATDQESATGFYPHAGLLSTFQYLRRYPTTETNRNRLRARMYYQHFLGVDALELAARVSDAAAVTAKYEIPTMQASECVVCHKTIDPVAGLFQDYYKLRGRLRPPQGGLVQGHVRAPASRAKTLPAEERWRALQWLGERTAKDPRFAVAMVEHVYYILTGRKVLLPPKDLDDPLYAAKRRAYQEQRRQIEAIAARFAEVRLQPQERLQGLDRLRLLPRRRPGHRGRRSRAAGGAGRRRPGAHARAGAGRAEGRRRLRRAVGQAQRPARDALRRHRLAGSHRAGHRPERRDGRDPAHPGQRRGLQAHAARLRAASPPSGGCSRASSPTSCPAPRRRPTPRSAGPSSTCTSGCWGATTPSIPPEVDRARSTSSPASSPTPRSSKGSRSVETYHCRPNVPDAPADPHYTIRAWRGVVTYLLRRPEFLYE